MSTRKKWELDRRTFLRGAGITMALPLLDAMVPSVARAASTNGKTQKFMSIYIPNGLVATEFDPNGNYRLSPTVLNALGSARSEVSTIRGLRSYTLGEVGGQGTGNAHPDAWVPYINAGRPARYISGMSKTYDMYIADVNAGSKLDCLSIAADYENDVYLYEPIHMHHMSYRGPDKKVDAWRDPKALFDSLFSGVMMGQNPTPMSPANNALLNRRQSIMHFVSGEITSLKAKVGIDDKARLDEYFTGLEDLEKKITSMTNVGDMQVSSCTAPTGITNSSNYPTRLKMLYEIAYYAFKCDMTRVVSFLHAMEGSHLDHKPFVPGIVNAQANWHGMSHLTPGYEGTSNDNSINAADLERMIAWHFARIGEFVSRLKGTVLPNGQTMLDEMLVTWGSSIAQGGGHHQYGLMNCYAGTGNGFLKKNIDFDAGKANISNLWLTYAQAMGSQITSMGNSTGTLGGIRS